MLNKIIDKLINKLTKNKKELPLFYVTIDMNKFKESKSNSCTININSAIVDNTVITNINELVDYIRENLDEDGLV